MSRCVLFYAELFFGKFYVGELFQLDARNIYDNQKEGNDLKFCPISVHSSRSSYNGFVLSRCEDESEYSLYWFLYAENNFNLFTVDIPAELKTSETLEMAYEVTPVLYSKGE